MSHALNACLLTHLNVTSSSAFFTFDTLSWRTSPTIKRWLATQDVHALTLLQAEICAANSTALVVRTLTLLSWCLKVTLLSWCLRLTLLVVLSVVSISSADMLTMLADRARTRDSCWLTILDSRYNRCHCDGHPSLYTGLCWCSMCLVYVFSLSDLILSYLINIYCDGHHFTLDFVVPCVSSI